jgi:hypothetical protein
VGLRTSRCDTPARRARPVRVSVWPMKRILRDVQFWIPVVVLIGGLLVLQWIR